MLTRRECYHQSFSKHYLIIAVINFNLEPPASLLFGVDRIVALSIVFRASTSDHNDVHTDSIHQYDDGSRDAIPAEAVMLRSIFSCSLRQYISSDILCVVFIIPLPVSGII
jgi:hypothetical protein